MMKTILGARSITAALFLGSTLAVAIVLLVVILDTGVYGPLQQHFSLFAVNRQQHCGYQQDINDLKNQIDILRNIISETNMSVSTLAAAAPSFPASTASSSSSSRRKRTLAEVATTTSFTHASDFGVVGDGATDDTSALQGAIDSAANNDSGGTVILPKGVFLTTSSLVIPGGITVRGQGYGSSPLAVQFDAGGSTIAYCGTDYAVKLAGHGSSLQDAAVYDWRYPVGSHCDQIKAAGGVLVDANNNNLVESVTMNNVLIYWFMEGAALTLKASNSSGIAYSNFQNIRVRHAKTGISVQADEGSFVNSNSFFAGAISGGITDAGIHAQGPGACNDNKFIAMVIEPSHTNLAHVYVTGKKTNIHLLETRLEGTDMFNLQKPLVIIDDDSYGNIITGMLGHTHVQADFNRNPGIDLMSAKSVGLDPAPLNHFWNAAFKGLVYENNDDIGNLPGWKAGQTNRKFAIAPIEERLYAEHNVLNIDYLNWGGSFKLEPDRLLPSPGHSFATFGIYAKTNISGAISAVMRYTSGSIISSAKHSGSGEWEFIGMSALYDIGAPLFYFSITDDVQVTAPHFAYGQTSPTPGASLISSSGAQMSGTLSLGMATAAAPESGNILVLPRNEGNIFVMDMKGNPNRVIQRINDGNADRFPRGSVITLIFPEAGTTVVHGGYIKLRGEQTFTSTLNSALTLVGNGGPSWTEISRNEQPNNPVTNSPTDQPSVTVVDQFPTANPASDPTVKPTSNPTSRPTNNPTGSPTRSPTSNPTNSPTNNPTSNPTNRPTKSPTDFPTLSPTEPVPDDECGECMGFLSNYEDADDSKAAEKACKVISSDKDVQKACKKVVKDVLKKGLDELDSCKAYNWCS